ncbi:MAG: hypothetical protein IPM91_00425 [Bacteroidetes bacterium]|nr:hypothetical protein [Bacteroidota bacterium]
MTGRCGNDRSRPVITMAEGMGDRSRPVTTMMEGMGDRSRPVTTMMTVSKSDQSVHIFF